MRTLNEKKNIYYAGKSNGGLVNQTKIGGAPDDSMVLPGGGVGASARGRGGSRGRGRGASTGAPRGRPGRKRGGASADCMIDDSAGSRKI